MHRAILLAAVAGIACAPQPDLGAERAALRVAERAWLAAAQAGDVDSALTFWAEDAQVIAPGQPPYVGRAAIRGMLEESMNLPGFSVWFDATKHVVAPSGEVAWSVGTNVFTVPNATGGIDTLRGQGVVVWRKGADGRWRSVVDTWTPAP